MALGEVPTFSLGRVVLPGADSALCAGLGIQFLSLWLWRGTWVLPRALPGPHLHPLPLTPHWIPGPLSPTVLWLGPGDPCVATCGEEAVWIGWGLMARTVGSDPRPARWPAGEDSDGSERCCPSPPRRSQEGGLLVVPRAAPWQFLVLSVREALQQGFLWAQLISPLSR